MLCYVGYFFLALPLALWIYKELTMGVCRNKNSMTGKTVLITGGSEGIGLQTAIDLAKRGAKLIIGCRRAQQAVDRIQGVVPGSDVTAFRLDLSSKDSITEFCSKVRQTTSTIDVLINNAGIVGSTDEQKTKKHCSDNRHEKVMAINYFGHVLLNKELMDLVKSASTDQEFSRVIIVSSSGLMGGNLHLAKDGNYNLDDMRTEQDGTGFSKYIQLYGFHGMQYMNSKQAQLLYGRKLAQILSSEGANVSVTVLHPGLVRTSIFDGFATRERITIGIFENLFGKSVEQGAQTSIYLATEKLSKESINGKFFADCRPIGKQIDKFAPHDMLDSFWDYTNRQL